MADEADQDLELEIDEIQQDEGEEQGQEGQEGEAEEDLIGFGEEAAPASEESSTIREMRAQLRDAQRRAAVAESKLKPVFEEPGPKPQLEDFNYDADAYADAVLDWHKKGQAYEQQKQDAAKREEKDRESAIANVEAYKAERQAFKVPDFDAAEKVVHDALGQQFFGAIMETEKRAALVYALYKNPAKLDEIAKLSETNPLKAVMMIGKLEDKVTVNRRKPPTTIDTPLRGNTNIAAGEDRELAKLEKEADRTGDRTKLIAYKRRMKAA